MNECLRESKSEGECLEYDGPDKGFVKVTTCSAELSNSMSFVSNTSNRAFQQVFYSPFFPTTVETSMMRG